MPVEFTMELARGRHIKRYLGSFEMPVELGLVVNIQGFDDPGCINADPGVDEPPERCEIRELAKVLIYAPKLPDDVYDKLQDALYDVFNDPDVLDMWSLDRIKKAD